MGMRVVPADELMYIPLKKKQELPSSAQPLTGSNSSSTRSFAAKSVNEAVDEN
jgi:hypothetical protein